MGRRFELAAAPAAPACLTAPPGAAYSQPSHRRGPVAQLGERYVRIVEVSGSIPLRSTIAALEVFHFEVLRLARARYQKDTTSEATHDKVPRPLPKSFRNRVSKLSE